MSQQYFKCSMFWIKCFVFFSSTCFSFFLHFFPISGITTQSLTLTNLSLILLFLPLIHFPVYRVNYQVMSTPWLYHFSTQSISTASIPAKALSTYCSLLHCFFGVVHPPQWDEMIRLSTPHLDTSNHFPLPKW